MPGAQKYAKGRGFFPQMADSEFHVGRLESLYFYCEQDNHDSMI